MYSKVFTARCLIVSIQLVFVLGQTPRNVLFLASDNNENGRVKFGVRKTSNFSSANDVDVDGRYLSQGE